MPKPLPLLATAVLCLAVGVLIGARLLGGFSPTLAGAATGPSTGSGDAAGPATAARAPDRSTRALEGAPLLHATSLAAPRAVVAAGPAALPPPPAADVEADAGASSVDGTVVTLTGEPLAGVVLELEPPRDAPRYRVRTTTSDEHGRFAFTGLPRGVWDLRGEHPDHVLQRKTSYPTRIPTGATVELLACPGVGVEVRVEGLDADRARVAYRRDGYGNEPRWSTWSPERPTITLGPGAWKVCAFVDPLEDWPSDRGWKLAPFASAEHTVQVGIERPQPVTLTVESVSSLYGTVRLPDGHQGGSRPQLKLIEPVDGTRADFDSPGDRTTRNTGVDEQGRFGFFRLPYERWTLGIALSWGTPSTAEPVDVQGLTRIDFDRFEPERENSVVVDAFSPAGQRITEGISLTFLHRNAGDEPEEYVWRSSRTVLEEGGSLRVIPLPLDQDAEKKAAGKQELVLRAWMSGFATIDQPLSGLKGERHRLSFTASAELAVELVGEGALRSMRKAYASLDGEQFDAGTRFDEAEEALVFKGLHPGSYTLTVRSSTHSGNQWRQERLYRGKVDVQAGSSRLEIPMPPRNDLVVRCPGVKKDVEAYLRSVGEDRTQDEDDGWGGTFAEANVDELGQVRFDGVLAGTYHLWIGSRVQLVRIPTPTFDFAGVIPDRYMFRLDERDSPLGRAGVRSGDVLVAIDGEELGAEAAEERLEMLSAQSEGTLLLTVERSGRNVDLTLDAASLGEDETFTASLEPDLGG